MTKKSHSWYTQNMFTGIIKATGTVMSVNKQSESLTLALYVPLDLVGQLQIDDSLAVNGVCQTVTQITDQLISVDVVFSTLTKTTLGQLQVGDEVNLELAMRLSDRLGGHLVQGHVQTTIKVSEIVARQPAHEVFFDLPENMKRYILAEASVCLDGVSLTVAKVEAKRFSVAIIPHTWEKTTFKQLKIGSMVNLEVDILAKYVEQLMSAYSSQELTHDLQ